MIFVIAARIKKLNGVVWRDIWISRMADELKRQLTEQEILMVEAVLKTAALERLLVKHNIITTEELTAEMKALSAEVIETMRKSFLSKKD